MGKKDLYITVPSFFKCPISLDVMKSPVSLSTGVTYDRDNIQHWLSTGNTTCPATMQRLNSTDFVPNHTLRRLIQTWSHNINHPSLTNVLSLIDRVSDMSLSETRLEDFIKIICFASESLENKKFLAGKECFAKKLAEVIALEGPDLNPDHLEAVLKLFEIVTCINHNKQKNKLMLHANPNLIPNLAKILKSDRADSRVAVVRILEATSPDQESKKSVFENSDIVPQLFDIINCHVVSNDNEVVVEEVEIQAVLSCLISLSTPRCNKIKLIEVGIVTSITKLLTKTDSHNNHTVIELALTLLEMLVGCTEGRGAITEDQNCIPVIITKLMKVSRVANEHAIALLWSLCHFFREQKAREIMTRSNGGLTKILLTMQSDCSGAVKMMCCDLLRVFRVCSKSCLSSYDTKSTHIMPC